MSPAKFTGYTPFKARRTSAEPKVIDGVTWLAWQTGLCQVEYRSECGLARVWSLGYPWRAEVRGLLIGKLYRSRDGACKAAAKAMRKQPLPSPPDDQKREVRE